MVDIVSTAPPAPAQNTAAPSAAVVDRATIGDNLDTFLTLLTTQLRNQNPLDPIDTNQFTQQLVQFSTVEQSVKSNDLLQQLLSASISNVASTAVSYIGKTVNAEGATTRFASGQANWTYQLNQDAPDTAITIRNAVGAVVFTEEKALTAGTGTYQWDGSTDAGYTAPEGLYTITMNALSGEGNTVNVTTTVDGVVNGVDMTGNEPMLLVGEQIVALSAVRSVKQN